MRTRRPDASAVARDVNDTYERFGLSQNTQPVPAQDPATELRRVAAEPVRKVVPIYMPGLSQNTRARTSK